MTQENNNEIDLLLRRLRGRQGALAPEGDLRSNTDHLDADELSSYAENALPAPARARYTEHLAECSRCRELVVQLSSSAGVVVAEEIAPASMPSGLKKFLAGLFSPMVLRYAVPALGLIVAAMIGFAVLRSGSDKKGELVATSNRPPQVAAEPQLPLSGQPNEQQQKYDSPKATPQTQVRRNTPTQEAAADAPAPTPVAAPGEATGGTKTAAEQPKTEQQKEQQPVATAPAPAAPAAKPAETSDDLRKLDTARGQNTRDRSVAADEAERRSKIEVDKRSDDGAKSGPAKSKAMEPGIAARRVAISRGRDRAEDKDLAEQETRSVAGRRFRKQRGIWVDTAFNDGATMNVTRGSEQYRALVADEPAIKTIAEQLDGQIIVVWKGRAYQIR